MSELSGKKILMFVENVYEDLELWYPKIRLTEAGAEVIVAGPDKNNVYDGKHGYPCKPDAAISAMKDSDFDAVVLA